MVRVLALCLAAAGIAASGASAAQTPAAYALAVHAAAKQQRSVHYVSTSKTATMQVAIVADSARDRGIQRIAVRASGKTGHVTVIVAGGIAYLRGDTFALSRFIGFKQTPAIDYANQWIRIDPTSATYAPVAAAVTLGSAIDELGPQGTLAFVKAPAGQRAMRGTQVRGGVRIVDTLYAQDGGQRLPVREVVSRPGVVATDVLSGWNKPVHVTVPTKTVPIAKVLSAGGPTA